MNTGYDRFCLSLSKEEIDMKLSQSHPYVIRLLVPEVEKETKEKEKQTKKPTKKTKMKLSVFQHRDKQK